MEKKSDFNNKTVVVSGGGRGLGLQLCKDLLTEGYRVATFSRKASAEVKKLQEEWKDQYFFAECDVTSDRLGNFVDEAAGADSEIFAVINNAAVAQDGVLATLPEIEISKMISVNFEGAARLTRLCVRKMISKEGRGGRVVNISSITGIRGYNGLAVYSATKAALDGLTRSLARELGRAQITVNSVSPGYMRTDLSAGLNEDRMQQIIRRTPLNRMAELQDITPTVVFLLSQKAEFITGQNLVIDGGITC